MLTTELQQAVSDYQDRRLKQEAEELERLLKVEFECKCSGFRLCDGCCKSVLAAEVKRLRADNDSQREQKCAAYREAARLEAENRRLRAQLPEGMDHCTILFKSCKLGHGWLTAINWVQHECPTCEQNRLRVDMLAAAERIAAQSELLTRKARATP
jgi:aminoglycoside phosphotransferase